MAGDQSRTDCSHLNQVQDHLDGRLPPLLETEFLQHVESCPVCQAELDGLQTVQDALRSAAERPLPALDRRAVAEALFESGERARLGGRWVLPGLAVGAASAAILLAVFLWPVREPVPMANGTGETGTDRVVADVIPLPTEPVVVTFMAGEVVGPIASGPNEARRAIEWPVGVEARTGRGELVARVDPHTTLAVGPNSRATIAWTGGWEIGLEQGAVAAALQPGRTRKFRIGTSAGVVEAIGTRFSVERRGAQQLRIGLGEGKLALTTPTGARSELAAPVLATFGPTGITDLGPISEEASGPLALLKRPWPMVAGPHGSVSLRSTPSNAQVLVDGRVMGATPLTWSHPAQAVSVEVRAPGFKPVQLALVVQKDRILERHVAWDPPSRVVQPKPAGDPLARVRKLLAAREVDKAQQVLKGYLDRNPGEPRGLLMQADAHRIAGRARVALATYREVVSKAEDAHLAEAAHYQAGLLQLNALGDPTGALATFLHLRRSHPKGLLRQEVAYHLAECYLASQDYRRALRALEDYLRLYPGGTKAEQARTLVETLRQKGWK